MDQDAVIVQLRNHCPLFANNVAGAAQFERSVQDETWMPTPAAYVVPLDQESSDNQSQTGLKQVITDRIGVIVCFDSSADRRGQIASNQINITRAAIFSALLNWHIDPTRSAQGLYYGGARRLDFDRARLFWQYEFCFDEQYTDADGFQLIGQPLVGFDKDYLDPMGRILAHQFVPIPKA